jgi:hypothetical protein
MATQKQKLAAKKILENPGKPISTTMKEVGYSDNTAKNPSDLTDSKGWNELMDKYLPDDKVLATHEAGLEATKTSNAAILLTKDGQTIKAEEQGLIEVPDHATRLKAVELAYKVKKKIGNESVAAELKDGDKTVRFIITRGEE